MKNIQKVLLAAFAIVSVFAACTKEPPLFFYHPGKAPSLTLGRNDIRPDAPDSNVYVFRARWSNPEFQTDLKNVKFITQVAMAGTNFANPISSTVIGSFSDSMQAKVLNAYVLQNGIAFGQTASLETRVIASYTNNNDLNYSNTVPFTFRAYKVPPRVQLPFTGRLFLVGSATAGGWGNPVPVPTQEFARINETTFAGVFELFGGGQYLALPQNGNWDFKYSVANTNAAGLAEGGAFGYNLCCNFPGPAADGIYKITFDFQVGTFKVEPFTQQHGLPTQLVVVGGASPWGWNNSVDNPQRFTQLNSAEWEISRINLKADDGYLILPTPGDWSRKYGVPNRNLESARIEGSFIPEGQDFKSPLAAGDYRIRMNFVSETYRLTRL